MSTFPVYNQIILNSHRNVLRFNSDTEATFKKLLKKKSWKLVGMYRIPKIKPKLLIDTHLYSIIVFLRNNLIY